MTTPDPEHLCILGIESSCDETAAAVTVGGKLRSNIVSTQLEHAPWGGVIPELASRLHQVQILPVVEAALQEAGITRQDLHAVAFTQGPGLLGALLVGTSFAKGLALGLGIDLIGVNHLQGHIASLFIEPPRPAFPFMCLTASGGHTQLSLVHDPLTWDVVGATIDDAAGEAFDKVAKILGFPFPGGPNIDRYAEGGDIHFHRFPRPRVEGFHFSFSGLKTSFLYYVRDRVAENPDFVEQHLADLCASIQHRIVTFLLDQLFAAAAHHGVRQVAIAGGVSANSALRRDFERRCQEQGMAGFIPAFRYCTDNAAMIALTGHYKYLRGETTDFYAVPHPG